MLIKPKKNLLSFRSAASRGIILTASRLTLACALLSCACGPANAWPGGKHTAAAFNEAKTLFNERSYTAAALRFSTLLEKSPGSAIQKKAYWYLGQSYEALGQVDKALNTYQLAVQLYPKEINLVTALARLYYSVGLFDRSLALFKDALALEENDFDAHIGIAKTYEKLGFLSKASSHYKKALDFFIVRDAELWKSYANCLLGQRNYVEAEAAARKALDTSPHDPDALLILARVQYESGHENEALLSLEKASLAAPGRKDISLRRSLWLSAQGDAKQAESIAKTVLRQDPFDPLAQFALALAFLKSGKKQEALIYLKSASDSVSAPFIASASDKLLELLEGH